MRYARPFQGLGMTDYCLCHPERSERIPKYIIRGIRKVRIEIIPSELDTVDTVVRK